MAKLLQVKYDENNKTVSLKIDDHCLEISLFDYELSHIKSAILNMDDQKKIIKLLVENL